MVGGGEEGGEKGKGRREGDKGKRHDERREKR